MMSGTALFLLTAAAGYWVLERASDQKKDLKMVGQLVGAAIIILSLASFACKTYWMAKYGKGYFKGVCPSGPICPFTAQKPQGK